MDSTSPITHVCAAQQGGAMSAVCTHRVMGAARAAQVIWEGPEVSARHAEWARWYSARGKGPMQGSRTPFSKFPVMG